MSTIHDIKNKLYNFQNKDSILSVKKQIKEYLKVESLKNYYIPQTSDPLNLEIENREKTMEYVENINIPSKNYPQTNTQLKNIPKFSKPTTHPIKTISDKPNFKNKKETNSFESPKTSTPIQNKNGITFAKPTTEIKNTNNSISNNTKNNPVQQYRIFSDVNIITPKELTPSLNIEKKIDRKIFNYNKDRTFKNFEHLIPKQNIPLSEFNRRKKFIDSEILTTQSQTAINNKNIIEHIKNLKWLQKYAPNQKIDYEKEIQTYTDKYIFNQSYAAGKIEGLKEIKKNIIPLNPNKYKNDNNQKQEKENVSQDETNSKYSQNESFEISKITRSAKQIRNITVNIDAFNKGGINTQQTNLQHMDSRQIEDWFTEMCLRVVRNLETSY